MGKSLIVATITLSLISVVVTSAFAQELSNDELLARITKLEEKLAGQTNNETKTNPALSSLAQRISFNGLIEVEGVYGKTNFDEPTLNDEDSSDITLATVELGVDVAIAKHVSGHVVLLWEEDSDESVEVDEGFILIDGEERFPAYLRAGKFYLPFGNFTSNMVSDPLTLELGEINESAVEIGFKQGGFYGAVYFFNGDIDEEGQDSHVDNYGATVGYTLEQENFNVDVGAHYINNLIDSDGWGDHFEEEVDAAALNNDTLELNDYVDGFGAHIVIDIANFTLIGEYIGALDDPEYLLNGIKIKGDAIAAWNTEVCYTFDVAERETSVAIAYQGSDDAGDFIAESRYVAAASVAVIDYTTASLEYLHEKFENDDKSDIVTAQLAIEF